MPAVGLGLRVTDGQTDIRKSNNKFGLTLLDSAYFYLERFRKGVYQGEEDNLPPRQSSIGHLSRKSSVQTLNLDTFRH